MPVALLIAFAASLGIHVAALFGTDFDLSTEPEAVTLVAELRPLPKPQPLPPPLTEPEKKSTQPVRNKVHQKKSTTVEKAAVSVPQTEPDTAAAPPPTESASAPEPEPDAASAAAPMSAVEPAPEPAPEPRLPPSGRITYRVERGDAHFEIGVSRQEWSIVEDRYRLTSVVETTGLVWLFKAYRIEMESRGRMTPSGLRPDSFVIRRNGQESNEKVEFDWSAMKVRVGNQPEQELTDGAQDLLSFNYELGFLSQGEVRSTLPIATGRKYGIYRLEVLGDEDIEIPAGILHTLHLRAPGENTTELWLAYDYLLLPVKIRHVDNKGDSLVQVATEIKLGTE